MKILALAVVALALVVPFPVSALETVPVTMDGITLDAERVFIGKAVSGNCISDKCSSFDGRSEVIFVVKCTKLVTGTCESQEVLRSERIITPDQVNDAETRHICIGCNYLIFVNSEKHFGYISLFKLTSNNSRLLTDNAIAPYKSLHLQHYVDILFPHEAYDYYGTDEVVAEVKRLKAATP